MRLLYLIPSLGHGGAGKQLEMLAQTLHQHLQVEVCQFAAPSDASPGWSKRASRCILWAGPGGSILCRSGSCTALSATIGPRSFMSSDARRLRCFALVGRKLLDRVVLSQPFAWDQRLLTTALDRWLYRKVARIMVQGEAEAALGKSQGLFLEKIAVVPPGIADNLAEPAQAEDWRAWPRKIVCVGPLARHKGHRNAIWTFDFLRYRFEDLHLVFVGDGPDEAYLRRMADNARRPMRPTFCRPGPRPPLAWPRPMFAGSQASRRRHPGRVGSDAGGPAGDHVPGAQPRRPHRQWG